MATLPSFFSTSSSSSSKAPPSQGGQRPRQEATSSSSEEGWYDYWAERQSTLARLYPAGDGRTSWLRMLREYANVSKAERAKGPDGKYVIAFADDFGLGNRIDVVLSSFALSVVTGRALAVVWPRNARCGDHINCDPTSIDDLFDPLPDIPWTTPSEVQHVVDACRSDLRKRRSRPASRWVFADPNARATALGLARHADLGRWRADDKHLCAFGYYYWGWAPLCNDAVRKRHPSLPDAPWTVLGALHDFLLRPSQVVKDRVAAALAGGPCSLGLHLRKVDLKPDYDRPNPRWVRSLTKYLSSLRKRKAKRARAEEKKLRERDTRLRGGGGDSHSGDVDSDDASTTTTTTADESYDAAADAQMSSSSGSLTGTTLAPFSAHILGSASSTASRPPPPYAQKFRVFIASDPKSQATARALVEILERQADAEVIVVPDREITRTTTNGMYTALAENYLLSSCATLYPRNIGSSTFHDVAVGRMAWEQAWDANFTREFAGEEKQQMRPVIAPVACTDLDRELARLGDSASDWPTEDPDPLEPPISATQVITARAGAVRVAGVATAESLAGRTTTGVMTPAARR